MQLNKNIKIFSNYFLGPLLFAWLLFSIYQQITRQSQLEESWLQIKSSFQSYKISYLIIALLLIPVNWGLEALKWKFSLKQIYPISFLQSFKAVLSGVSFSVTMPNRVGEYLGRMMFVPEGNRLKTISVTLVGSFAQLLVTIVFGIIGLVILKKDLLQNFDGFRIWYQFILYGLMAVGAILAFIYFNVSGTVGLFKKWSRGERHIYLVEALQYFNGKILAQILLLSFIRYLVFIVQYIFIFYLFEVNVSVQTIIAVMGVLFLAMAIIPSITLIEIGLRGEISIMLMGLFSANKLGIGFSSVTVWFINLILPAIIGSLLILNLRIFKRRNESSEIRN
jgi:uncharacterized membrane protein YbhN (UPF0104 family)